MLTLTAVTVILFLIAALASAEKSPPRKALPAPCEVQCLEAKNAALQKLAVKRLRLLSVREHRIVRLMTRLRRVVAGAERDGRAQPDGVKGVICSVFGAHCSEALRVAQCESGLSIWARNPNPPAGDEGDYLGLFQMGSYARARYGHGWDAWTQSRAAHRYFLDAGWSPWECKP